MGLTALFQLATILILHGQEDSGAEALLKVLQIAKMTNHAIKENAQQAFVKLIAIFELKAPERATELRRQMQNMLF